MDEKGEENLILECSVYYCVIMDRETVIEHLLQGQLMLPQLFLLPLSYFNLYFFRKVSCSFSVPTTSCLEVRRPSITSFGSKWPILKKKN